MNAKRTLIVGIGSPHGDDQIGWHVADGLAAIAVQGDIDVHRAKSPVDLLDWLEHIGRLVICDACHGIVNVGEVRRWKWPAPEISEFSLSGTHNLSLPAVLGLADKLGRLPEDVVVWAIEGGTCHSGQVVSAAAMNAVPDVVKRIACELNVAKLLEAGECTSSP